MTTENTIPPEPAKRQWLPRLRSRWWTLLLGLSLMANLLVGGLAIGHFASGGAPERIAGITYIQLIPRSFFHELSFERRREFMKLIRERSKDLRNLRDAANAAPVKLADALELPVFDLAAIQTAVYGFTTGSGSLAASGGNLVTEIVGKLTPEERKLLAAAIRERAENLDRRKKK